MNEGTVTVSSGQLAITEAPNGDLIDSKGRRWVTMSNALTRAAHGLTLAEKRIMAIAASTLDSRRPLGPGEAPKTRIMAADYADTYGVDMDTAYRQLREGAKNLFRRYVTFYTPAHKRNGKPLPPTENNIRWAGRCTYHKGEGWVEIAWWYEILPHLFGLQRHFTTYQLEQASALRSVHSWNLLKLLMRFESTGWAEYAIEDFAVSMEATEKQRANFAKIRTKIIEPAVTELVQKDGWLIDWKPIKAGRKVKAIRFDFYRNPQGRLDLSEG